MTGRKGWLDRRATHGPPLKQPLADQSGHPLGSPRPPAWATPRATSGHRSLGSGPCLGVSIETPNRPPTGQKQTKNQAPNKEKESLP